MKKLIITIPVCPCRSTFWWQKPSGLWQCVACRAVVEAPKAKYIETKGDQ